MYCLGGLGRRDGPCGRFKVTLSVAMDYFRLRQYRPAAARRPAWRLTWPGRACHRMDRAPRPDAGWRSEAGTVAGLPGGRQIASRSRLLTSGRDLPDGFAIQVTGEVGKAVRKGLPEPNGNR